MLFNSLQFIVLFLPMTWIAVRVSRGRIGLVVLSLASTVFYVRTGEAWYLLPLFISVAFDYTLGAAIARTTDKPTRRRLLVVSLAANLGMLAYFKYAALLVRSASSIASCFGAGTLTWVVDPLLPAGISFYTFQSMSYVIDVYRGRIRPARSLLEYYAFVSFFPQLVAGPIARYETLAPQLLALSRRELAPRMRDGVLLFAIGLCKKVLLADRLANAIDPWIAHIARQSPAIAWLSLFGYALQIYFDFSGYSDMAIGLGAMFGIQLPTNFDSPYKASSPSDFWRRWHITLSQWIRDYLYVSLGGNHGSKLRVASNLVITMGLAGLWHGANWTFVAWGLYHGLLLVLYHRNKASWDQLPGLAQRAATLLLVVLGWVFFRAEGFGHALLWFAALLGLTGAGTAALPVASLLVAAALAIAVGLPNSQELVRSHLAARSAQTALGLATAAAIVLMNYSSTFIYYRF